MFVLPETHMGMHDTAFHYVLVGIGLTVGSIVKVGFDKLAEHFWDSEWKEFKKWKDSKKD